MQYKVLFEKYLLKISPFFSVAVFLVIISLLFTATVAAAPKEGEKTGDIKVSLCHVPPGDPGNIQSIRVDISAVEVHLAHGDTFGDCVDTDEDGVFDLVDNCLSLPNPDQEDADKDSVGNACDVCPDDVDKDAICKEVDNCPLVANDDQADADKDGLGDACDACPDDAANDADDDGICGNEDRCPGFDDNADTDNDTTADGCDPCPYDAENDADNDGVCGDADRCSGFDDNADADGNGIADGCEIVSEDTDNNTNDDASDDSDDGTDNVNIHDDSGDKGDKIYKGAKGDKSDIGEKNDQGNNDTKDKGGAARVTICHFPQGNPENVQTITVSTAALNTHLDHGDFVGVCTDDSDLDGIPDDSDNCPAVSNHDQANADGDSFGDICDACPHDAANDADSDGVCGDADRCAGHDDTVDTDGDGTADGCDACPHDAANDADSDGVCGDMDNCPTIANVDQVDTDGDGPGNACDTDDDNDGTVDTDEAVCGSNPVDGLSVCEKCDGSDNNQDGSVDEGFTDTDADGVVDCVDACPNDKDNDADKDGVCGNVDQCPGYDDKVDTDKDGIADGCDTCLNDATNDADDDGTCGNEDQCPGFDDNADTDNDTTADGCDPCPYDAENDADSDGVCGDVDNCPFITNADQVDTDNDGSGNACDADDDNGCDTDTEALVSFEMCEPAASPVVSDMSGEITGTVSDPEGSFTGDGYFHGDGVDTCLLFQDNQDALLAADVLKIKARIRPENIGSEDYIRRILARDKGGNYQVSVWRNTSWETFTPPDGVASIAFWLKPVDAHGGMLWKPVLSDYDTCPIVSDHWYEITVQWDSGKLGFPADIFVEDQGFDGQGSGRHWAGTVNCTDADQSQVTTDRHLQEGDTIFIAESDFAIGCNANDNQNNVFEGLIDYVRVDSIPLVGGIDNGDLVISEVVSQDGAIYYYDIDTGLIRLLASGGPIHHPEGMVVTDDGKIIVADWWAWTNPTEAVSGPRSVYEINPATAEIRTIITGTPLIAPIGVVLADDGNLIVIDHGTNNGQGFVLKVDLASGTVLARTTHSQMWSPQGIVRDESTGNIYLADHTGRIFRVDGQNIALTNLGSIPAPFPQDLIVTDNGSLLIATLNGEIYFMDPDTGTSILLHNDNDPGDAIPSGSNYDSLAWLDDDTFVVVNHFSAGDIFAFDYDQAAGRITSATVLYDDGEISGGPLNIPLGVERYSKDDNAGDDCASDVDSDGVCGDVDNCPDVANVDQADTDNDGTGDACERIQGNKLYALEPSGAIERLISIDPDTAEVETVLILTGSTGFRANALAFSPAGELFGWDNFSSQLFKVDLKTGEVIHIGTGPAMYQWVNGLAFDSLGNLYGSLGDPDELLAINTETGQITVIGPLGVDVEHNGLAVDFETDQLYAVSGLGADVDYLLKLNKEMTPLFADYFSTDSSGEYTWVLHDQYPSGTGYQWNSAGHVRMDGIYNGSSCCWIPALVEAGRAVDTIPASGYARLNVHIVADGAGQSRLVFSLQEDESNWYRFRITDDTYGGTGYTQGVTKSVNGVEVDNHAGPGTVSLGGNETNNNITQLNEEVLIEAWWSPTSLRLAVNGTTVSNIQTVDTTAILPTSISFRAYRFEVEWDSVEIFGPQGLAEIIGPLGVIEGGVGVEFNPATGELFTVRNSSFLKKVNILTGESVDIGVLGDGAVTTNLAAPWPAQ